MAENPLMSKKELMSTENKNQNKLKLGIYMSRILKQVHECVSISSDAKDTLNMMIQNIVERILNHAQHFAQLSSNKTIGLKELQSSVAMILPEELVKCSISEAKRAIEFFSKASKSGSKSERARLTISVSHIDNLMKNKTGGYKQEVEAPVFMAGVIEFLAADILELSGNKSKWEDEETDEWSEDETEDETETKIISPRHIFLAVEDNLELSELFTGFKISNNVVISPTLMQSSGKEASTSELSKT